MMFTARRVDELAANGLIGVVLRAGVIASSLASPSAWCFDVIGNAAGAQSLLHAGILMLLATPVARVVVSIVGTSASGTGRSRR